MVLNEFISQFEQDVVFVTAGTVTEDTVLSELEEWDSLAFISTIAIADEMLSVQLNGEQLSSCRTFGDLIGLVKHQLE